MSTVRADNFANRLGTSSIPADTLLQGTAKAWLNLNGTGTIAARDSFNVSSVVDNGTGDYTVNFLAAQANANYSVTTASWGGAIVGIAAGTAPTTAALRITSFVGGGGATDVTYATPVVAGDPA